MPTKNYKSIFYRTSTQIEQSWGDLSFLFFLKRKTRKNQDNIVFCGDLSNKKKMNLLKLEY